MGKVQQFFFLVGGGHQGKMKAKRPQRMATVAEFTADWGLNSIQAGLKT